MNCGIELAAIEKHLLIIRPGKCLETCAITILDWRTKGALSPFLEYWGRGYSPPPVPTPVTKERRGGGVLICANNIGLQLLHLLFILT